MIMHLVTQLNHVAASCSVKVILIKVSVFLQCVDKRDEAEGKRSDWNPQPLKCNFTPIWFSCRLDRCTEPQ